MRFAEMPSAIHETSEKQRKEIFQKLNLGRTEVEILKAFLKLGSENVYKLSKYIPEIGHYSTFLRALRRLEKKRLVRPEVEQDLMARNQKIYALTTLGELLAALDIGGWEQAANMLAEKSRSFREAIQAHRPFAPFDYWVLTRDTIERLTSLPKYKGIEPSLEGTVIEAEEEWIAVNIVENLNDPEERSEVFQRLKKLSHVDWIRSLIIRFIDGYVEEEQEWLHSLETFKNKMASTEKTAKLPPFFLNEKQMKLTHASMRLARH